jgi:hypothetical protein
MWFLLHIQDVDMLEERRYICFFFPSDLHEYVSECLHLAPDLIMWAYGSSFRRDDADMRACMWIWIYSSGFDDVQESYDGFFLLQIPRYGLLLDPIT